MRKSLLFLTSLTVVALLAAPAAMASSPTAGASSACPGYFRVLHNDKISGVSFKAGPYDMVTSIITCNEGVTYFQKFLAKGKVYGGWSLAKLSGNRYRFTKVGTKKDFQVTPGTEPTPPPGPSPHNCPGYFRVLHNDRIGDMQLPAGRYQIILLSGDSAANLNCQTASNDFAYFLNNDWSGNMPSPWWINGVEKTFYRGEKSIGFRVKRIGS